MKRIIGILLLVLLLLASGCKSGLQKAKEDAGKSAVEFMEGVANWRGDADD